MRIPTGGREGGREGEGKSKLTRRGKENGVRVRGEGRKGVLRTRSPPQQGQVLTIMSVVEGDMSVSRPDARDGDAALRAGEMNDTA
eukprot:762184-Hanusia_phi.AAC.1